MNSGVATEPLPSNEEGGEEKRERAFMIFDVYYTCRQYRQRSNAVCRSWYACHGPLYLTLSHSVSLYLTIAWE